MSWFDTLIRRSKQYSTDHENEQTINHDNLSELYVACFEGDLDRAHRYLSKTPFAEINRRECNGSTALHAAVQCGHIEMIDLLLNKYGVMRHLCDNQGRTAYDLAKSNEIRRLFQRPTSNGNRFCEKPDSLEMFSSFQKNNKEKSTFKRVETYGSYDEVRRRETLATFYEFQRTKTNNDFLYNFIFQRSIKRTEKEQLEVLLMIIEQSINPSDLNYNKAMELFHEFSKNKNPESLIRLYTLETPLYRFINRGDDSKMIFATLMNNCKDLLYGRSFTGTTYRGLGMTSDDLQIYHWARENPDRYLQLNTFCSSTLDEPLAKMYADANANEQQKQVLIIFNFLRPSVNAIDNLAWTKYVTALNKRAKAREFVIKFLYDELEITSIEGIELKASALAEITQATAELTRKAA
ncbi:unnamed protein product, partial [Rotaria sp. Silwood1]